MWTTSIANNYISNTFLWIQYKYSSSVCLKSLHCGVKFIGTWKFSHLASCQTVATYLCIYVCLAICHFLFVLLLMSIQSKWNLDSSFVSAKLVSRSMMDEICLYLNCHKLNLLVDSLDLIFQLTELLVGVPCWKRFGRVAIAKFCDCGVRNSCLGVCPYVFTMVSIAFLFTGSSMLNTSIPKYVWKYNKPVHVHRYKVDINTTIFMTLGDLYT